MGFLKLFRGLCVCFSGMKGLECGEGGFGGFVSVASGCVGSWLVGVVVSWGYGVVVYVGWLML